VIHNLGRLAKALYTVFIFVAVFTFLCGCTSSDSPAPQTSPVPESTPETGTEPQNVEDSDVEPSAAQEGETSAVPTEEPSVTQQEGQPSTTQSEGKTSEGESSEGETDNVRYVKGDGVRMRESPSTEARIKKLLSYGNKVILLEDDGRWSKVYYENTEGYIRNDLLSDTIPKERTVTKPSVPAEQGQGETQSRQGETPATLKSPKIIVKKSERKLELWNGDTLYGTYPIGLGRNPEGDKKVEGDGRTPEGTYYVCVRNPNSRFYLSLGVSYPNKEDAREALEAGVIDQNTYNRIANAIDNKSCPPWNTAMGGAIMIHGMGSSSDWTAGCVAVDNDVMDILWEHCPVGTPIIIQP